MRWDIFWQRSSGCLRAMETVSGRVSDIFNGLMAVPNLAALVPAGGGDLCAGGKAGSIAAASRRRGCAIRPAAVQNYYRVPSKISHFGRG